MNALVAYASSDEDEDDIQPEKPSKIAKTASNAAPSAVDNNSDVSVATDRGQQHPIPSAAPSEQPQADIPSGPGPAPQGPSAPPSAPIEDASAPFSPYTFERQRLRELTMPPVPNFDIPDSPPPPQQNSEEAATLAATAKKFERFLELKRQGVHFNGRLQNSSSLRNPSLLSKLLDFAGVSVEESYASALSDELAVPVKWPDECYVEALLKQNERREKKRVADREKVDFVPAVGSDDSSAVGTPAGGDGEQRRSKFSRK